jgi:hypothetical protein
MKQRTTQLDFKIDQNTAATWEYLKQKYHGKKPDDIFQLALETLANREDQDPTPMSFSDVIDELAELNENSPYSEEDIYKIWNDNKSELRV